MTPDATTGIAKIAFNHLNLQSGRLVSTFTYTVEEVAGTDATVSYDTMVTTVKVEVKLTERLRQLLSTSFKTHRTKKFNNTVKLLQKNLSSNQRNTSLIKRNSISQVQTR